MKITKTEKMEGKCILNSHGAHLQETYAGAGHAEERKGEDRFRNTEMLLPCPVVRMTCSDQILRPLRTGSHPVQLCHLFT